MSVLKSPTIIVRKKEIDFTSHLRHFRVAFSALRRMSDMASKEHDSEGTNAFPQGQNVRLINDNKSMIVFAMIPACWSVRNCVDWYIEAVSTFMGL